MVGDEGAATLVAARADTRVQPWEGTHAERGARAREALARAELLTGARSVHTATAVRSSGSLPDSSAGSSASPPAGPRVGSSGRPSGSSAALADDEPARRALITTERPPMAVPAELAPLLPDGLRRGGTTVVEGSTSLVLALVAHACAHGAWVAVVGRGDLGVLAAAQAGVDLGRLAMVPTSGPDAPAVVAALLDGLDVVVVGPGARLTDADRRRLSARARDRGAVLLPTYAWPGAGVTLAVERGRWAGVGAGDGWLRVHRLRVVRRGRGVGASPAVDVVLPLGATAPDWADEPALAPTAETEPTAAGLVAAGLVAGPIAAELRLVG